MRTGARLTKVEDVLSAGAGRAVVELPPSLYPFEGFGGEHDELTARVLVLDDGGGRLALVVVDMTSLPGPVLDELSAIVSDATGAPLARIAVVPTHTFSAPHVSSFVAGGPGRQREQSEQLRQALRAATRSAAVQASRTLRPARIGFGSGYSSVNVNRNVATVEGWWLGANDAAPSDKTVGVVRVEDEAGAPIAVVANFAVQSSIMDRSTGSDGRRRVSADLAGAAMRHVEASYGTGTVALFLIGAAGDQAPLLTAVRQLVEEGGRLESLDAGHTAFCLVELLGERLGSEIVRVSDSIEPLAIAGRIEMVTEALTLPAQVAPRSLGDIRPTRVYTFEPDGATETVITAARIGEIAIAGVQPELSAVTGMEIKRRSPFRHTLVVTMFNGGAKYMADAESYDRITYQAMNSRFARGCAETLTDRMSELLIRLAGTERR